MSEGEQKMPWCYEFGQGGQESAMHQSFLWVLRNCEQIHGKTLTKSKFVIHFPVFSGHLLVILTVHDGKAAVCS